MNTKNLQKWEQTRKIGEKKFVWTGGVLFWGMTTAVIWSVVMQYVQPQEDIDPRPIITRIVFSFGGYFFGSVV